MSTQTSTQYPPDLTPDLVDVAVAAVSAQFVHQHWTEAPLRDVVAKVVAVTSAVEDRYQMSLSRCRWFPLLCRGVAVDATSEDRPLAAHRVGFRSGFVWFRLCADVDQIIEQDVASAPKEDWRDIVRREPPLKDSPNYFRLFWADDRSLDEARLATLDAEGFIGRATPEGYTLEPDDEDCDGVVVFPRTATH